MKRVLMIFAYIAAILSYTYFFITIGSMIYDAIMENKFKRFVINLFNRIKASFGGVIKEVSDRTDDLVREYIEEN